MNSRHVVPATCLLILVAVSSTAAVTGTVMKPDGTALSGARIALLAPETIDARRVRLLSKTPERPTLTSAITDANGRFAAEAPKEVAIVDVRITANGYTPDGVRVPRDEDLGGIMLAAAETRRGTVTAGGKPVSGAAVVLTSPSVEVLSLTDAAGHYSVADPEKWASRLTIVHPDLAVLDEALGPFGQGQKGLDRSLNSGTVVRGRVVAEDGVTPAGAVPLTVDGWPLATSADDGSFTIAHAPAKWEVVMARTQSHVSRRARTGGLVTLKLSRGAQLSGNVRNAKTLQPLPGMEIRLLSGSTILRAEMGTSTFTDAKGNYSLPSLTPGTYETVVSFSGYEPNSKPVTLIAAQKAVSPLLLIEQGRVAGSVVDEEKRPLGGTVLTARPVSREGSMAMARMAMRGPDRPFVSTPDGRFVIRTASDTDIQLEGVKRGLPPVKSGVMRLTSGEKKNGVILTIARGVLLTGLVKDRSGKPISGVGVRAEESLGGASGIGGMVRRTMGTMMRAPDDEVRTGSDGTFSLRVKEGIYDVSFKREGYAARSVRGHQVSPAGKPIDVTLDPGVEVAGRVTRGGKGIEGVNVNSFSEGGPASAVTGFDGSFRLTDLTPGTLMLNIRKQDDFIQQMRTVTAPAQDVNIDLPAGGRITGRVADKSSHQPVTSFQAGISGSRSGGGMVIMMAPQLRTFTSDDGTFALENVPPGPAQLIVNAPGYTAARIPSLEVEDGKTLANVSVELDTGLRLTGRITGPGGSPVSGATVQPSNDSGRAMGRLVAMPEPGATTDSNGEYTLDAIEPGDKTFHIFADGLLPESKTIKIEGKDARLDVQLSSGSRVSGQVVTEGGVPVAEATVAARSQSLGKSGQTDGTGTFQMEGLAPGHYTFSASKKGYADGVTRDFDITAGAPLRIVLKTGAVIYGHVSGLTEAEMQHANVWASSTNGEATAAVGAAGDYRIDGAPAGSVHVDADVSRGFSESRNSQPRIVTVEPGGSVQVDLEFKSQTVITGRVTRNGQPAANAMVGFQPRGSLAQTSARVTTDGNGLYTASGLEDSQYSVTVMDVQRLAPYSMTYSVHGSGTFDIDIKAATLRGRVVDVTGEALADARVQLRKSDAPNELTSMRAALTDAGGNFAMESVAPGSYNASADKDGYGHEVRPVTIGDTQPDAVELKLVRNDGISIKVVDARDGRDLAASLRATDSQGRVVFDDRFRGFGTSASDPQKLTLAPGRYRVSASAMGYATRSLTVTSPGSQTIGLTPGGTILVTSKSSSSRRARLFDSEGQVYWRGTADGTFVLDPAPGGATLRNVAPGSYVVQVLDEHDQVVASKPVVVMEGQATQVEH